LRGSKATPNDNPMAPNDHKTRPSPVRTAATLLATGLWLGLLFLVRRFPPDGRDHGDLGQFVGRLHPLLVHVPVALLVLVPAMELAGLRRDWAYLRSAAGWVLAVAAAATFAAAFDGWLLGWSGGYRGRDVTRHLWGGVMLAAVCAAAARARFGGSTRGPRLAYPFLLAATLGLMVWTADGGGAITRGDGYLTDKMPPRLRSLLGLPAEPARTEGSLPAVPRAVRAGPGSADPSNPAFYQVHVAPLFARSCVSCHRAEKHKGGLRLDSFEQLMRGGEDGKVVAPDKPGSSDLVRRLRLPPSDDDSMPSDGEKPFTQEEIQMIEHWIAAGAKSG
jgi:uncharacterized membrane protein